MPGSPMLDLKGMRILMFQLSGLKFQPSKEVSETRSAPSGQVRKTLTCQCYAKDYDGKLP